MTKAPGFPSVNEGGAGGFVFPAPRRQMPAGPTQIGVSLSFSFLQTYASRQSAWRVHDFMQPACFPEIASFTQMVPAGHAAPPTSHGRLHMPPGA